MFVKTLLKYKFVVCLIVIDCLMIASSLLQPWPLAGPGCFADYDSKAIYQAGAWLIGMGIAGLLVAHVTTAAYIAQAVSV